MRISQLVRTYNLDTRELQAFLESIGVTNTHPNVKLYDTVIEQVLGHFGKDSLAANPSSASEAVPEPQAIPQPEIAEPEAKPQAEIMEIETTELTDPKEIVEDAPPQAEIKAIPSDQLLQLLEKEEPIADLDKITLIKAPKKELSGLKIVGKVDLPASKKKEISEEKRREQEKKAEEARKRAEEREKQRVETARKKREYEARQAKRQQEQKKQEEKARKAAHYHQKVVKPTAEPKTRTSAPRALHIKRESAPPPSRNWLVRFWRWLLYKN